jgi:hypothetical protein
MTLTPTPTIPIPAYATAVGYTKEYRFDDFTSNSIGSGTSGTNWYLNSGIGATTATSTSTASSGTGSVNQSTPPSNATVYTKATAAQVANGNRGAGSFASPKGGILVLNGPNWPGNGNITIMTTPPSSQKSYIPSFGVWRHVLFEAYIQYNINFYQNNQWPAWWFNPQMVVNGKYNEIDGMEQFGGAPGNFNYPATNISFSGHEWNGDTGAKIADGGGSIGTVSGGVFTQTKANNNFHKYGVLLVQTGTGTGYIEMYHDDVKQVTYDQFAKGNSSGRIATGTGGVPGFRDVEIATYFMMLGGAYGKSGNSASVATANMNVDWVRVLGKP